MPAPNQPPHSPDAPPSPHQSFPDPGSRLTRLEEAIGHTDRTAEQLSAEIVSLNQRVQAVSKRLAALESRLGELESPEEEGEG